MNVTFSDDQARIIEHKGSCLITGVPGSGKTLLIIEKAARLAMAEGDGESVCVIGFSWRGTCLLEKIFQQRYPQLASKVRFATLKDLAQEQLEKAEKTKIQFADNARVRKLLTHAMRDTDFTGNVREAEHIIRTFRNQLRNPKEGEPHFALFQKYKDLIDKMGVLDRHTIIRRHIVAMDNGTADPSAAKYILLDNVQDITPIQLRWLQGHMKAKAKVILAGNDDLTTFGRDGALGVEGVQKVMKLSGVQHFDLTESYRTPHSLMAPVSKIPRLLKQRISKREKSVNPKPANLHVQEFGNRGAELSFVLERMQQDLKASPGTRVGIVVRSDEQALRINHLLRMRGVNTACYARIIWERKGAQLVLDLLYLVLNQAKDYQLYNIFGAFGVSLDVQSQLAQKGLQASGWLMQGAPLPQDIEGDVQPLSKLRRQLKGVWSLIQARQISPRDAFKVLVHDLLPHLNEEERRFALLALDMLLNVKGRLQDVLPRIQQEILPDMSSRIVVAPVREVRNMEFDVLYLPFSEGSEWPSQETQVLGVDEEHERRLFYMAVSRAKGSIAVTYSDSLNKYIKEMQTNYKSA